jgi:hypothetical protein
MHTVDETKKGQLQRRKKIRYLLISADRLEKKERKKERERATQHQSTDQFKIPYKTEVHLREMSLPVEFVVWFGPFHTFQGRE